MYELLVNKALATGADICICNVNIINQQWEVEYVIDNKTDHVLTREEALHRISGMGGDGLYCSPCNKIYKDYVLKTIRYPVGKIYEDAFIFPQIILACHRIAAIPDAPYFYFMSDDSIMRCEPSIKELDRVCVDMERARCFHEIGWEKEGFYALYIAMGYLLDKYARLRKIYPDKIMDRVEELRAEIKRWYKLFPSDAISFRKKLVFLGFFANLDFASCIREISLKKRNKKCKRSSTK